MVKRSQRTLSSIGELISNELHAAVARPTLANYKPHAKQVLFHKSPHFIRLLIGGNRSGKTVGGITEDVMCMTGRHHFVEVPRPPVHGRICTVSYTEGIQEIIIPQLKKWLAPSDLIGGSWEESYRPSTRLLTLENGSTTQLMSYDQALQKFMGVSKHWIHMDEEPPKNIYNENKLRVLDAKGRMWLTLTPVDGMTWIYDDIYVPGMEGDPNIFVVEVDMDDNPHLDDEMKSIVLSGMDSDEIAMRKSGKFVQIGGLAFKGFTNEIVLPEHRPAPLDATLYTSMDHGFNAPTAWLWMAVLPNSAIYVYDELYDREKVVNYYAAEINAREKLPGRRPPDYRLGDPAIKQRQGVTGESIQTVYAQSGILIAPGNNNVAVTVDKGNRYINEGLVIVSPNCHNFIREMKRVRWKIFESAKKREDNPPREELDRKYSHSPDAFRYFVGSQPDLYVPKDRRPDWSRQRNLQRTIADMLNPSRSYRRFAGGRDLGAFDPNFAALDTSTEWVPVDEYMGGIY